MSSAGRRGRSRFVGRGGLRWLTAVFTGQRRPAGDGDGPEHRGLTLDGGDLGIAVFDDSAPQDAPGPLPAGEDQFFAEVVVEG